MMHYKTNFQIVMEELSGRKHTQEIQKPNGKMAESNFSLQVMKSEWIKLSS